VSLLGFEVCMSVRTVSVLARIWSVHVSQDSQCRC